MEIINVTGWGGGGKGGKVYGEMRVQSMRHTGKELPGFGTG